MIADWLVKWYPSLYRKVLLYGSIGLFTSHKLLQSLLYLKMYHFFLHPSPGTIILPSAVSIPCFLNIVHECYYYILSLQRDMLFCYKNTITEQLVLKCCWSVHEVIQLCELTHTHYQRESLYSVVSSDEDPVKFN